MERESRQLTTGEAAELLSVEPDTVLKWIKKGKIAAVKTPGGHHRIDSQEIDRLLDAQGAKAAAVPCKDFLPHPLRCWEYFSDQEGVRDECLSCVVHEVRAAFCFEMLRLARELGHSQCFCQESCKECVYYRRVTGASTKVLLITADPELLERVERQPEDEIDLRCAANGYCASAIMNGFRPGFVLVDRDVSPKGWRELVACLHNDQRLPGLKVVLVVPRSELRQRLDRPQGVAGVLGKPFGAKGLLDLIESLPVEKMQDASRPTPPDRTPSAALLRRSGSQAS